MKKNLWFFVGLLIVVSLLGIIPGILSEWLSLEGFQIYSFVIDIVKVALGVIVTMGLIKIALAFAGGGKGEWDNLFSAYRLFFNYLFGAVLYGLIIFVGLLLLVVPGLVWAIQFGFYKYLIVDKELGPIEALKESSRITKDVRWHLFLFAILLGLINVAGILVFGIGLFVTIPTTIVAAAYVYRKLLSQTLSEEVPE